MCNRGLDSAPILWFNISDVDVTYSVVQYFNPISGLSPWYSMSLFTCDVINSWLWKGNHVSMISGLCWITLDYGDSHTTWSCLPYHQALKNEQLLAKLWKTTFRMLKENEMLEDYQPMINMQPKVKTVSWTLTFPLYPKISSSVSKNQPLPVLNSIFIRI